MRIDWAIPCRYVEVNDNLATIVGGGIDHTWVPSFPHPIQVLLAVRFVAPRDELGEDKPHTVTCRALDAENQELARASGDLAAAPPGGDEGDWLLAIHMPIPIVFEARLAGTYTIEISVDEHQTLVPMHVSLQPGAPA